MSHRISIKHVLVALVALAIVLATLRPAGLATQLLAGTGLVMLLLGAGSLATLVAGRADQPMPPPGSSRSRPSQS